MFSSEADTANITPHFLVANYSSLENNPEMSTSISPSSTIDLDIVARYALLDRHNHSNISN